MIEISTAPASRGAENLFARDFSRITTRFDACGWCRKLVPLTARPWRFPETHLCASVPALGGRFRRRNTPASQALLAGNFVRAACTTHWFLINTAAAK